MTPDRQLPHRPAFDIPRRRISDLITLQTSYPGQMKKRALNVCDNTRNWELYDLINFTCGLYRSRDDMQSVTGFRQGARFALAFLMKY